MAAFHRPAEWGRQSHVIMAWPSAANDAYKDDKDDLVRATKDVSAIVDAVSLFEPVTVVVTPQRERDAKSRFRKADNVRVQAVRGYEKLDLWMRDMAPTFVLHGCALAGVDYNFNGWGNRYPVDADESLASMLLQGPEKINTTLVTEGGSLEVDGEGTLLVTESSVLNKNRNPGWTKAQAEDELKRTLGVTKVIWIPGRPGLDLTDCHVDGLARFVKPGSVVLSRPCELDEKDPWTKIYREARDILSTATDARGRKLKVHEIAEADFANVKVDRETRKAIEAGEEDYPSFSYVNYLLVNGGVIFPQFGDKAADKAAKKAIQELYEERDVEAVYLDELPFLGGGIHCSTQEVPHSG